MDVDWTYAECDHDEERLIQQTWEIQQERIYSKLAEFSTEPSTLLMNVTHDIETDEWSLQALLKFPARTIEVVTEGNSPDGILSQTVSKLIGRLERLHDRLERPSQLRQRTLGSLQSALEADYRDGNREEFLKHLRPAVNSFCTFVRRELDVSGFRNSGGPGDGDVNDVLNDTLLLSWERFPDGAKEKSLERWLFGLVTLSLLARTEGAADESLDEIRDLRSAVQDIDAEMDTWVEQPEEFEALTVADLLQDDFLEQWDDLSLEERQPLLSQLLSRLPRLQRQTLMLNAAEGYEPEAIADLQGRPLELVLSDLHDGRDMLRKELLSGEWIDEEERFNQPGGRDRMRRRR